MNPGALAAIVSAFVFAVANIAIRKLGSTESAIMITMVSNYDCGTALDHSRSAELSDAELGTGALNIDHGRAIYVGDGVPGILHP